jgi:hypothetical protein
MRPEQDGLRDAGVYHITDVYKPAQEDMKGTWLIEFEVYRDQTIYVRGLGPYEYQDDTKNFFSDGPVPITYEMALVYIL